MGEATAIRTFLALELGDAARRHAAAVGRALRDTPGGDDVRWLHEETLHVTLRFLGRTDPADVPRLVREVAAHTRAIARFSLTLGAPETFPARRPHVVALGIEPADSLRGLAAAVERGVTAAGFEPETRAFHPHVTLGRARRARRVRLETETMQAVTASVTGPGHAFEVMESVLFRSHLSAQGAHYTPLERIPLGAPGGPLHPE